MSCAVNPFVPPIQIEALVKTPDEIEGGDVVRAQVIPPGGCL